MKMEDYAPWLTAGVLGLGVMYLISQQKQIVAPQAVVPGAPPTPVGVPSFTGEPSAGAAGVTNTLLAMAEQQLGIPKSELIIRGLRPEDLGLVTSWNFSSTAANTWENWVNSAIADTTFVAIVGVSYGGTNFSQLQIQAGARTSGYANLNFVSGLINQMYFFADPVIIEQNQPVLIQVISKAVATEGINLMGVVVEKRGLVVSP